MSLTAQREEAIYRLGESRLLLELIVAQEAAPPEADSLVVLGLRGLFFVSLYACLEFALNSATQRALSMISSYNVQHQHFSKRFHTVALADVFASVRDARFENRFRKQTVLIEKIFSSDVGVINTSALSNQLTNVWVATIVDVFYCFGIDSPALPNMAFAGHIDEVVENRNAVAHGRKSLADVAGGNRSPALKQKWEIISATIEHIFDTLTRYIDDFGFVATGAKDIYRNGQA